MEGGRADVEAMYHHVFTLADRQRAAGRQQRGHCRRQPPVARDALR